MRFLLTLLMLACAGCSSAEKKAARQAEAEQSAHSRAIEERRLRAVARGEVSSQRGAEIYVADTTKAFDLNRAYAGGGRGFATGDARTKGFASARTFAVRNYTTRGFYGQKDAWMGSKKFATAAARTKDYAGPNAGQAVDVKTAATKEANEAGKTAATRALPGGNRPYLGPEAAKVKTALDPNNLPRSSNELKELKTVEDIRELLNKNQ